MSENKTLNQYTKECHTNAASKGFWDMWEKLDSINTDKATIEAVKDAIISQNLMSIVGELAEAQQALRIGDTDNFAEELADTLMRLLSLAGALGIDLESEISKKMAKNKHRPHMHGKKF